MWQRHGIYFQVGEKTLCTYSGWSAVSYLNFVLHEREINDLSQEVPNSHEWTEFLANTSNKFHLVNLIVDHIKSPECRLEREVYINKGPKCFFKDLDNVCHEFSELNSNHREADQKNSMHVVVAGRCKDKPVCVITDDTDIHISLIYIAPYV